MVGHDDLREHLAIQGFPPGIGLDDQHHTVAVRFDRGAAVDLDRTHGVDRHAWIGGERLDPSRDGRRAFFGGERRGTSHAEQHVAIDHHGCRRQLGFEIGGLCVALLGGARVGGEHQRLEDERTREQRGDCCHAQEMRHLAGHLGLSRRGAPRVAEQVMAFKINPNPNVTGR